MNALARITELKKENARLANQVANLMYLREGKDGIWKFFERTLENFDGSEYQQGVKDGLRQALTFLGDADMADYVKGGPLGKRKMEE